MPYSMYKYYMNTSHWYGQLSVDPFDENDENMRIFKCSDKHKEQRVGFY